MYHHSLCLLFQRVIENCGLLREHGGFWHILLSEFCCGSYNCVPDLIVYGGLSGSNFGIVWLLWFCHCQLLCRVCRFFLNGCVEFCEKG